MQLNKLTRARHHARPIRARLLARRFAHRRKAPGMREAQWLQRTEAERRQRSLAQGAEHARGAAQSQTAVLICFCLAPTQAFRNTSTRPLDCDLVFGLGAGWGLDLDLDLDSFVSYATLAKAYVHAMGPGTPEERAPPPPDKGSLPDSPRQRNPVDPTLPVSLNSPLPHG